MEKVGRNGSCPCGSGKKYKQCCETSKHLQLQKSLNMKLFK
ncbi:SEC-C domain-containing protein [Anaerobacillus sp. HL2]|nr:SEC-C domain-containing protein [Anaerobacillus sp. HL2]